MTELSPDEQKKIYVDMLQRFDKICTENNIKYSLAYGTLLGAVRHKGLIPWDDDIDVLLPRDDYEKLLSLRYEDERYVIKSYRYSKDYYYIFAKMMDKTTYIKEKNRAEKYSGLYIDIQPADRCDINDKLFTEPAEKAMKKRFFIDHLGGNTSKEESKNFVSYILKNAAHLVLDPFRLKIFEKIENDCKKGKGEYMANVLYDPSTKPHRKQLWDELIDMPYETITAKGFKNYDEYLSKKYGDYMTLPPENERITHHTFDKAYKINSDEKEQLDA